MSYATSDRHRQTIQRAMSQELSPVSATGGWLRVEAIAKMTGLGDQTVRSELYVLERRGLVTRRRKGLVAGGAAHLWRLTA